MALLKQGSTTLNAGSKGDKGDKGDAGISGGSNPNINPVTSLSELLAVTGMNEVIDIQEPITLLANYQIPSGQQWIFSTGYVNIDSYELDLNSASLNFNGKTKGLDLFNGSVIGNVTLLNDILYSSNIGGVDDDLSTTDNFKIAKNGLHVVNQNSSTFWWNKQDTGNYHLTLFDSAAGSPFIYQGFSNDNALLVGNGYNNVTITSDGDVKLYTHADDLLRSAFYNFYKTKNSRIHSMHFVGDRYEHFYDQRLRINNDVGATSGGTLDLRIVEFGQQLDSVTVDEVSDTMTISAGNQVSVAQDIVDGVNNSTAFQNKGWSARIALESETPITDTDERVILRGTAGLYSRPIIDGDTSDANISQDPMLYEWGHCLVVHSNSEACTIDHCTIEKYHGDGIAKGEQGNGTQAINASLGDTVDGYIDSDGVVSASTDYFYTKARGGADSSLRPMPGKFDNAGAPNQNWFILQESTNSSRKLLNFRYWVLFYDVNGDFIEKSPAITPYEIYHYYNTDIKQYKLLFEAYGSDQADFNYNLNSPSYPRDTQYTWNKLIENRRHGATNGSQNSLFANNYVEFNSGVSPEGLINWEDWGFTVGQQIIKDNVFRTDNKFCISIKGANRVTISGNKFIRGTENLNEQLDYKTLAISSSFTRNLIVRDNWFHYKHTHLDVLSISSGNHYTDSVLVGKSGGSTDEGGMYINSIISSGVAANEITQNAGGAMETYITNAKCFYTQEWTGSQRLVDCGNRLHFKDITMLFNDKALAVNHFDITDGSNLRRQYLTVGTTNKVAADRDTLDGGIPIIGANGSWDGLYFDGIEADPSVLHRCGFPYYEADFKNFQILSTSLWFTNGYEKDCTVENGVVAGWLWDEFNEYPSDGVGTFTTKTFKNVTFNVPTRNSATSGYLYNTDAGGGWTRQKVVRMGLDKNVNLVFEDCVFNSADVTTGLFMYIGVRGTTLFKNCTFIHPTGDTIDFSSVDTDVSINDWGTTIGGHVGANTGAITVLNPTLENVTFTGTRAIDKIIYTEPNLNCESFSDNATALTALGEGYYYKDTTSGKFEVTIA